jgi:hypothetical protein
MATDSVAACADGQCAETSFARGLTRRGETLVQAQLRKEQALANLRELEVAQKRGELAPVGVLNVFMGGQIIKARDALMRIGQELCDRLAFASAPADCRRMIDDEVRRALGDLSLFGERWNSLFAGDGPISDELRRLLRRVVELVAGVQMHGPSIQ